MSNALPLPPVLAQIAAVVGEEAALKIAKLRGGTQVYIPPIVAADHWLAEAIGHREANILADELTCGIKGFRLEIPMGPMSSEAQARAQIDRMIAEGRSERDIALTTRYSIRTVRRHKAKIRDNRQMSLF